MTDARAAVESRELARAHDHMMGRALVIYNRRAEGITRREMAAYRVQIAEALVGEDLERRGRRRC